MAFDRRHHQVEGVVEHRHHFGPGHRVGQLGEAGNVGEQDRRLDLLAVAAVDLAVQHLVAAIAPDIGRQHRGRIGPQQEGLGDPRQRPVDPLQHQCRLVAEAAIGLARPARRIGLAGRVDDRLHQIVGEAVGDQLVDDDVVVRAVGVGQPAGGSRSAWRSPSAAGSRYTARSRTARSAPRSARRPSRASRYSASRSCWGAACR